MNEFIYIIKLESYCEKKYNFGFDINQSSVLYELEELKFIN